MAPPAMALADAGRSVQLPLTMLGAQAAPSFLLEFLPGDFGRTKV